MAQQRDQAVGPVHGLDRADAETRERRGFEDFSQQVFKTQLRRKVAAPAAKIDAGEDEFLPAGGNESLD